MEGVTDCQWGIDSELYSISLIILYYEAKPLKPWDISSNHSALRVQLKINSEKGIGAKPLASLDEGRKPFYSGYK